MPDLYFSVSQLDKFREWEEDLDADLSKLIQDLTWTGETPDTKRGHAFHAAMETVRPEEGELEQLEIDGYTFVFQGDFDLISIPSREVKIYKTYPCGLRVGGRVDAIQGNHIIDHKAATWFDAERYFKKYAWRYYLDIAKADRFTWHVWEMKETDDSGVWWVTDHHILEQFRYPELERDCARLSERMKNFADVHLADVVRRAIA